LRHRRDASVFVRAAMAHLNLLNIHPWRDGNGRMARGRRWIVAGSHDFCRFGQIWSPVPAKPASQVRATRKDQHPTA
jgi:fido (protein-threonine AMPylation protein)